MSVYRLSSALLSYPEAELIAALPELLSFAEQADCGAELAPLFDYLQGQDLIALQEHYVVTFDRTPSLSLHLFEHVHGESRDRGQAMVDLLAEYQALGYEPEGYELPDFIPLFLEFLSVHDELKSQALLDDAIHVMAAIGQRLAQKENPYACVLLNLTRYTEVVPRQMHEPPVRDMDDALETFGPGADGVEPLLKPQAGQDVIRFYRRGETSAAPLR